MFRVIKEDIFFGYCIMIYSFVGFFLVREGGLFFLNSWFVFEFFSYRLNFQLVFCRDLGVGKGKNGMFYDSVSFVFWIFLKCMLWFFDIFYML